MICIYVAIGQKESKVVRIVEALKKAGAMDYTIVINAPINTPAVMQYIAPYVGATFGEYIMSKGKDALIIYDDLTKLLLRIERCRFCLEDLQDERHIQEMCSTCIQDCLKGLVDLIKIMVEDHLLRCQLLKHRRVM